MNRTIEDELKIIYSNPMGGDVYRLVRIAQRLLQTLDGHNTGARADVARILGVDDLKPKIGPDGIRD